MGGNVAWDKVEAWLKANGATVTSVGDDDVRNYHVTRVNGHFEYKAVINAASFTRARGDASGTMDRTPFEVVRDSIANAAVELRISDATEVLGPNWKNEFPKQAGDEARNEEIDAELKRKKEETRWRSGSLSEPPEGPFKKDPDPGERDGEGEVR
ncbi:MAG: hypothetical protein U1E59_13305 [Amaricoccus sp.]